MKIDNYEYCKGFCTPAYWYEEGVEKEQFYVDSQTLYYKKFCEEKNDDEGKPRKYYIISPYKPIGVEPTKENIKWLVDESYHDEDFEFFEWNFNNHCMF